MKPKKKRKLTDDEIDALVIAEADDDSAWGDPIVVRASKSPRPAWMTQSKTATKRIEEPQPRDLTGGVRGKYARADAKTTNVAVIAPDLARIFPDSESVNEALRTLVRISGKGSRLTKSAKPRT